MRSIHRTAIAILAASFLAGDAPAAGPAGPGEAPLMAEVPEACAYLTSALASGWLRAEVIASPANEHFPTFSSQCGWSGKGVRDRQAGFVFKFMPWEMFDVAGLAPEQLSFNATFASGQLPLVETRKEPGAAAFVFEQPKVTVLMVVTGFRGPKDGAGRPQAFLATYRLSDPDTAHAVRLEKLLAEARKHLEEWRTRAG